MEYYWDPVLVKMTDMGDPEPYLIESLSLPKDEQELPGDHYELTQGLILGPVGSGKSTTKNWIAGLARDTWPPIWIPRLGVYQDQIEFFDAEDMGGVIEALRKTLAYVKFVVFEDAIRDGLEARRSGSGANLTATQRFFRIRHLVQEEGENMGGLIILLLVAQDMKRIEVSLRDHAAIFIFKGYVRGCEDFIKDNQEIMDKLYDLSDNATRIHRNSIRKEGYIIDKQGKYYKIITDKDLFGPKINWISTPSGTTFRKQKAILEKWVFQTLKEHHFKQLNLQSKGIKLPNLGLGDLKGELDRQLEIKSQNWSYCEVGRGNYAYTIYRAKRLFQQWKIQQMFREPGHFINKNKTNNYDPNAELEHEQKVINLLQVTKVANIQTIHEITKIPKNSLRNTLADKKELFENVAPGQGVYCLKGYNYTQEEIETIIGKQVPMKKLKMSG